MEQPPKEDRPRSPESRSPVRRGGPNLWFFVAMIAVLAVVLFFNRARRSPTIDYSFFLEQIDEGQRGLRQARRREGDGHVQDPPDAPPTRRMRRGS